MPKSVRERKAPLRPPCAPSKHDPPTKPHLDWSQILIDAVNKPGVISAAYGAFWNYSTGNRLLAMFECMARGIDAGPIHTFGGWIKLGRHVRKNERAITLCMPVTWSERRNPRERPEPCEDLSNEPLVAVRRRFIYRPNWFVLSQTDGQEYVPLEIPAWDERLACHTLMVDRVPFNHTDGNVQGYASGRDFAVSPLAYLPQRTAFHEIAHIVLGHTAELNGMSDGDEPTPRDVREVESEAVSLICCQSLGLPGEEFSRGYLQHWLGKQKIEERSVHRIFKAADQILKAGRPQVLDADSDVPASVL